MSCHVMAITYMLETAATYTNVIGPYITIL